MVRIMSRYDGINRSARGFTLIELMIGITIGLFLLAGIVKVFMVISHVNKVNNDMALITDNIRATANLMDIDLKQIDYPTNCAQLNAQRGRVTVHFNPESDSIFNAQAGLMGYEFTGGQDQSPETINIDRAESHGLVANNWRPRLPLAELETLSERAYFGHPEARIRPVFGSDVLIVRYASPIIDHIISGSTESSVTLNSGLVNYANRLMRLESCPDKDHNDLFLNTSISTESWSTGGSLWAAAREAPGGTNYHTDKSQSYLYVVRAYFVAFNADTQETALYRFDYTPNQQARRAQLLLEGVANMQLRYRVNTLDVNAGFRTAVDIENLNRSQGIDFWERVDAVEVSLMYQTASNSSTARYATNEKQTEFVMGGGGQVVSVSGTDSRYRMVVDRTVAIRNRLFSFPGQDRYQ